MFCNASKNIKASCRIHPLLICGLLLSLLRSINSGLLGFPVVIINLILKKQGQCKDRSFIGRNYFHPEVFLLKIIIRGLKDVIF